MSTSALALQIFDNGDLIPACWKDNAGVSAPAQYRVFNPTIVASGDGYAMVYRVVDNQHELRRLVSCKLTRDFAIVPGSIVPLSDLIEFSMPHELGDRARQWHADPRLAILFGRIYLTWNDGGNKPLNHQFILQLDPQSLTPIGTARELTREYSRVAIEKNWMLFESAGRAYAIYAICPHEILELDLDDPERVVCRESSRVNWRGQYDQIYGVLRGSAAPMIDGDAFLAIAHSSYKTAAGRRYAACFYRFEAAAPFRPIDVPAVPFELPNPRGSQFELAKLNDDVCEVVYPCGFVLEQQAAVVSYGINDEACAIARIDMQAVRASMEAASPQSACMSAHSPAQPERVSAPRSRMTAKAAAVPLFWWDAKGKRFDSQAPARSFTTGNFGDIASAEVVSRITNRRIRAPRPNERKLLSIGSVLHTARDGDVVWGTGAKGGKAKLAASVKTLSVHAVRGPLTLDVLRSHRIDLSKVKELFDPGCLLPLLYKDEIARLAQSVQPGSLGYRLVPHYKDDLPMRRRDWKHLRHFVPVDATPLQFIESIYGAERVISSSLHGIIFAESLGIPACWLAPVGGEDERKYYDYYYGTGRWAVKRFESVEDALRAEPMQLPKFRYEDYVATFPHEEVAELGLPGMRLGDRLELAEIPEDDFVDSVDARNFLYRSKAGIWATSSRSRLQTYVNGCRGVSMLELETTVRPFNPAGFRLPQRVCLTVNGHASETVEWSRGSDEPIKLIVRTPHDGSERCFVDLLFEARNVRSPRSMRLAPIRESLAICVQSIVARTAVPVLTVKKTWAKGAAKQATAA